MSCNLIHAEEVAKIFNMKVKNTYNPNNSLHKCYKGNGWFYEDKIKDRIQADKEESYFKSNMLLFIEYLYHVKKVKYSEMARKCNIYSSGFTDNNINIKKLCCILVKYRAFIKSFEMYYRGYKIERGNKIKIY